ncbi:hypothetical protein FNF27_01404 [Cafeteria roenbergensis]|uniref:Uncharacterized protein n=1 Tax=Cafeteria roenbergensis TaxID=33653 RepID=A0A5A8CAA7_CAFRO|nr:hypothetical protein FNF29_05799 [Cafeteria roenbergensis]KAA0172182.1 hypothetical protein FNF28_00185 [Cafeteria roenbergensis]KAA0177074.1 hypothetical protein FNF27_01404 [Cafeteria roenbergensis]|eukprot:KAA0149587.1 hypothetical protein FNF29_05799 [Cafeteria roenbergensis]
MARAGDDMMQGLPDPEAEYSTFSGPASTGTGTPKPTMLAPYDIGQPASLEWQGPKMWLLIKEGIHIILDRILLKDPSHLSSKCPLYSRLSRVEKRALVLRYATALVLRTPLRRDVLVDTVSMCVFEACEQEAVLEAPADGKRKPRQPFMQKVMGEALQELLGDDADSEDEDVMSALLQHKATDVVINDAVDRMRDVWMSASVAMFFDRLADGDKPPPVIHCPEVQRHLGIDYFLPPPPELASADERSLSEAIRADEEDAGKETVFAANLKKALRLARQQRSKSRRHQEQHRAYLEASGPVAAAAAAAAAEAAGLSPSAAAAAAAAAGPTGEAASAAAALTSPGGLAATAPAVPSREELLTGSVGAALRSLRVSSAGTAAAASIGEAALTRAAAASVAAVTAAAEASSDEDDDGTASTVSSPLWLSLRGMVGCNLWRDGVWPIISNDGHLTWVRFAKSDAERFWFLDGSDAIALVPMFLAWTHTVVVSARHELHAIGDALADHRQEDVSRGVQTHLENAVAAALLLKIADYALEMSEAAKASTLSRRILQEWDEEEAAERERLRQREEKEHTRRLKAEETRRKEEAARRAKQEAERRKAEAAAARREQDRKRKEEETRREEERLLSLDAPARLSPGASPSPASHAGGVSSGLSLPRSEGISLSMGVSLVDTGVTDAHAPPAPADRHLAPATSIGASIGGDRGAGVMGLGGGSSAVPGHDDSSGLGSGILSGSSVASMGLGPLAGLGNDDVGSLMGGIGIGIGGGFTLSDEGHAAGGGHDPHSSDVGGDGSGTSLNVSLSFLDS